MFVAYQVSLELIRELRPVVRALRQYDRELASQLQRAATSVSLNLAEGSYRAGGDRRRHFEIAAGSANEAGAALEVAQAWEWPAAIERSLALVDRLRAMLWRLTRGRTR